MILLTFDLEEFDLPLEYGQAISLEEQLTLSALGTQRIIELLREKNIRATFFITAVFAQNNQELIKNIVADGHEIASHGWAHSSFSPKDLLQSKLKLEALSGVEISGFRMPRLQAVNEKSLLEAGYTYDSSLSPTFIPGRYNNWGSPLKPFWSKGLKELPVSVTPFLRFPLFWLSFHTLPLFIYRMMSKWTLKRTKYLNLYFHPWEFLEPEVLNKYQLPFYIKYRSGLKMSTRLSLLIDALKKTSHFTTCRESSTHI